MNFETHRIMAYGRKLTYHRYIFRSLFFIKEINLLIINNTINRNTELKVLKILEDDVATIQVNSKKINSKSTHLEIKKCLEYIIVQIYSDEQDLM